MFPNSSVRGSTFLRPVLSDQSSDGEKRNFLVAPSLHQLIGEVGEHERRNAREQKKDRKRIFFWWKSHLTKTIKKLKRTGML